jgi:hypothetical protein
VPRCPHRAWRAILIRARTGEGRRAREGRKPKLTDHQKREAIKRRDSWRLDPCGNRLLLQRKWFDDRKASLMTTPLIVQIQETALDSKSSVTDALRKAKIACVKLGLTEFGNWVDLELNGYIGKNVDELPEYRKLHGIPKAFDRIGDGRP